MAKQSRESLIAELDARKIAYSDEMKDKELAALLEKAREAEQEAGANAMPPVNTDMAGVKCGLATVQDHELRIRKLEQKLA